MSIALQEQHGLFGGRVAPVAKVLRPYQRQDADRILGCLARGVRGTLYVLPTAGGKTVVLTEITDTVSAEAWQVWIFVHRRELLKQTSTMLSEAGIRHGLIAPDHPMTEDPVQVVSIDTAIARLDELRPRLAMVGLAVVDEAHHVVANKWQTVIDAMIRALLLGVTATPFRLDGQGLGDVFHQAVSGPTIADLISSGYLAPPAVYAPPTVLDLKGVKKVRGDYAAGQLSRVVDNEELTQAAVRSYAAICPGVPAIAFCAGVDHAHHVAKAYTAAGWIARAIDGKMSTSDRDTAIKDLAAGRLQVLTSCEIVSEGTDVPVVGAAILLRPTQSTGLYLQQVGRVLRLYPGKTEAIILDMVANVAEHGMPEEPRPWTLKGGLKRMERAVTGTRRCKVCHRVARMGPKACPGCRRPYVGLASIDPRLTSMDGIQGVDAALLAQMEIKNAVTICQTMDDLYQLAAIRGYKRGWADRQAEFNPKKFGVRPKPFWQRGRR